MIRKFYLVVATIFGLAISSCTNDVNEDIMADASGTLSNTDAEIVELKSGFTITKKMESTLWGTFCSQKSK